MWPLLAAGAAFGAGKYFLHDKPEFQRQGQLAAQTTRYSPWTGMQGQMPQDSPDLLGDTFQGGLAGGQFGSQMDLNSAMTDYYNRGGLGSSANKNAGIVQGQQKKLAGNFRRATRG